MSTILRTHTWNRAYRKEFQRYYTDNNDIFSIHLSRDFLVFKKYITPYKTLWRKKLKFDKNGINYTFNFILYNRCEVNFYRL